MERLNCEEETIAISRSPNIYVKRYKADIINGFRFHTKDRELRRRTQNSGVVVEVKEDNPRSGSSETLQNYFGAIKDIYELDYYGKYKIVLFRCD